MARCHVTNSDATGVEVRDRRDHAALQRFVQNVDEGVAVGAGVLRLVRVVGTITNVLGMSTNMEIAIMVAYPTSGVLARAGCDGMGRCGRRHDGFEGPRGPRIR